MRPPAPIRIVAVDNATAEGATLVECPVCAPITWVHCAGCQGAGFIPARDAAFVRVTLRR